MFADHLRNALRALRSSPVLTLLMVLALGLGIGACMTTLTVYRVLAVDPIPGKSSRVRDSPPPLKSGIRNLKTRILCTHSPYFMMPAAACARGCASGSAASRADCPTS